MNFLKKISGLLLLLLNSYYSIAQNCGCDKVITNSGYYVDGISLNIKPGDTICLTANRGGIAFRNIQGTESNPVVIINCGRKVTISTTASYAVKFEKCKNFKLTGTGSQDEYGIEVSGSHQGVFISDYSTDFELDHVEVHDVAFAGIMAKTDPVCNDSNSWRQNFLMKNLNIHHNYIHKTGGEGLYLGYSFYANGINCNGTAVYPHAIENIKVHHNKTFNTGCEGIQVGCATKGCEINSNRVETFGQKPFSTGQENGIQIGEGTGGLCYNNFIKAGGLRLGGNGIILLGIGDNLLFNNVIMNTVGYGIFIDERPPAIITDSSSGYRIINNTIINSGYEGVKTYAELVGVNEIKNNIIVNPGNGKFINNQGGPGVPKLLLGNNITTMDINLLKFVNPDSSDFHIKSISPAVDNAENGAHWNLFLDYDNLSRPKGRGFDVGAFEFDTSLVNNAPIVNAGNDTTIYYPQDSITITGVVSDSDGLIDSYYWSKSSNDSLIILNEATLTTKVKKLHKGTNTLRLNAIDNGNKDAFDELSIVVLDANKVPIVNAGNDTILLHPTNSLQLKANAFDADGSIVSYVWTQSEGAIATINNDSSLSMIITGLAVGRSVFKLTVIDNLGASSSDDVVIIVNKAPVANAGQDIKAVNTDPTFSLVGTASDDDGTIASVSWSKTSGPVSKITDSTSLITTVTGFKGGVYQFKLKVIDDKGAESSDMVQVNVNNAPVVTLGVDRVNTSTQNTNIQSTVNDPDGQAVTLLWTKTSGPDVTMTNITKSPLYLSNLTYGAYVFRLTATDVLGASGYDEITIVINKAPIANAGPDIEITWPQKTAVISGSGTDVDGVIASYQWIKLAGPQAVLENSTEAELKLNSLRKGNYTFRLQVKDNNGAIAQDDMILIVK